MEPDKDTSSPGRRFWPQFQLPTAASLQHRFYKYLLSKLTLLSNADLDQAEHPNSSNDNNGGGGGGGGFGHIVLRNVELDGDKLSSYLATAAGGVVPAAYVRHGGLARLELELLATGVGDGGTRLVGDGVRLTVALTRAAYSAATGDAEHGGLEGLLERTTADLAESIIMPTVTTSGLPGAYAVPASPTLSSDTPEYDLTDSESSNTSSGARQDSIGYGLGDFSGVVNRVIDAAVSRLDVVLRDVCVRVLIIGDSDKYKLSSSESLEDMELEMIIGDIRFRTAPDDGTRRLFEVGLIALHRGATMGDILAFPDDLAVGSKQSDFICQITATNRGLKQHQLCQASRYVGVQISALSHVLN
ncbi:hypothetical protein D0Z03_000614 [Geotrichum reessii]|nr:hypothetical protein D0Z03_000614 [Galactomyces reessii]